MPRGRAGLYMVPAEEVRVALARRGHTPWDTARAFGVADRTVRRWLQTGLALFYGVRSITREEWDAYAGQVHADPAQPVRPRERTTVDRGAAAAEPTVRAKARATRPPRREPRPPPSKRKKLRTSRDLLAAYRKLHSR